MTGGNRSSAVMQQRRGEAARRAGGRLIAPPELEYFPTPPWATRALCEFLQERCGDLKQLDCWEPAAGEGHMARPLAEYFGSVRATDVHVYEARADDVADFTLAPMIADEIASVDFVVTNPPFKLALDFIRAATAVSRCGFAMLVRGAFLESEERYRDLWSVFPPSFVLHFAERVVMLEGRLIEPGKIDPFAEKPGTKASSATAYVWLVWLGGEFDTRTRWIAPCRRRLERAGDYPEYSAALPAATADGLFA